MKRWMILMVLVVTLVGCGQPYPEFYRLTAEGPAPSGGGMGIGVGPIVLAEYVDRTNLVVETSPHKLEVARYHRWAGDLDNSIARVVATNMGRHLGTGNIKVYPWQRDGEISYQVTMDLREFVAGEDGYARIEANWRLYSLPGRNLVTSKTYVAKEAIEKGNFESMVAAQSKLLAGLSADIARAVRR
jgi:uncharacterized protein